MPKRFFIGIPHTLTVVFASLALGCPNARNAGGPGSYGNESAGEAMLEDEMEEAAAREDR